MQPQRFPEANRLLGPPEGVQDCRALSTFTDGEQHISMWVPDEEDRARIAAGEPIWLRVLAPVPPPVEVTTERPFYAELTRDSKVGDLVYWTTVVGRRYQGELIEWDSNVARVRLEGSSATKAVEC